MEILTMRIFLDSTGKSTADLSHEKGKQLFGNCFPHILLRYIDFYLELVIASKIFSLENSMRDKSPSFPL